MNAKNIIGELVAGEIINVRLGNAMDIDYCPSAAAVVLETNANAHTPHCICVAKDHKGGLVILPNVIVNPYTGGDVRLPAFYTTSAFHAGDELRITNGNTFAHKIEKLLRDHADVIAVVASHMTRADVIDSVTLPDVKVAISAPAVANSTAKPVKMVRTPFQIVYEDERIAGVPYSPDWSEGDYFGSAVKGPNALKLEIGQVVKSITPMPNNRKLLFVGTRFGTVCLFQRYTDDYDVIVGNIPDGVRRLDISGMGSAYSRDLQAWILGPWGDNIGQWIEKMANIFNPPSKNVVPNPTHFDSGMTVKELKDLVRDWPETDQDGDPTGVWVETGKGSCSIKSVWPLNKRDLDKGGATADMILNYVRD